MYTRPLFIMAALTAALSSHVNAETGDSQAQIDQLRQEYEKRLQALEARNAPARPARDGFNPAIGLVLNGGYAHLSRDPGDYRIQGFLPAGEEAGPGERGFSLGESELSLSAAVDPYFRGRLTVALGEEGAEVEEAYAETLALGSGLNLRFGRFLSGIGYLNEQHAHSWDFVDAPLAYRAFYGGAYRNEGLQARWLAPVDRLLEFGAELGNGRAHPGGERSGNGLGAGSAFVRLGDDWGEAASWQVNAWYQHSRVESREYETTDAAEADVVNAFSGDSDSWGLGAVFKWSPAGNARAGKLKLQAEYLQRREDGELAYDLESASLGNASGGYAARQSGWYAQAVWQFLPRWRVGLRHDRLDAGDTRVGLVDDGTLSADDFAGLASYNPRRTGLMLDWSLSEFSRLRLQFNRENSAPGAEDDQVFLQYTMSLGAHAAHAY